MVELVGHERLNASAISERWVGMPWSARNAASRDAASMYVSVVRGDTSPARQWRPKLATSAARPDAVLCGAPAEA
jgi:hypothetical protein